MIATENTPDTKSNNSDSFEHTFYLLADLIQRFNFDAFPRTDYFWASPGDKTTNFLYYTWF